MVWFSAAAAVSRAPGDRFTSSVLAEWSSAPFTSVLLEGVRQRFASAASVTARARSCVPLRLVMFLRAVPLCCLRGLFFSASLRLARG